MSYSREAETRRLHVNGEPPENRAVLFGSRKGSRCWVGVAFVSGPVILARRLSEPLAHPLDKRGVGSSAPAALPL